MACSLGSILFQLESLNANPFFWQRIPVNASLQSAITPTRLLTCALSFISFPSSYCLPDLSMIYLAMAAVSLSFKVPSMRYGRLRNCIPNLAGLCRTNQNHCLNQSLANRLQCILRVISGYELFLGRPYSPTQSQLSALKRSSIASQKRLEKVKRARWFCLLENSRLLLILFFYGLLVEAHFDNFHDDIAILVEGELIHLFQGWPDGIDGKTLYVIEIVKVLIGGILDDLRVKRRHFPLQFFNETAHFPYDLGFNYGVHFIIGQAVFFSFEL